MDIRITEIVINKKMGKKEARFALFISLLFAVMLAFSSFPAGAEFIKANIILFSLHNGYSKIWLNGFAYMLYLLECQLIL